MQIGKGMYGLPQAGILTNNQLVKHLAEHQSAPTKHTPGMYSHKTCPITFSLIVDNFSIKYFG
jgi:hypothetical protein